MIDGYFQPRRGFLGNIRRPQPPALGLAQRFRRKA